jgi:fatty-acyl-CoA synthase
MSAWVPDWSAELARLHGERTAVVAHRRGRRRSLSFATLARRAGALAAELAGRGVDQAIGVLAGNGVHHLDALFAARKLGLPLVPFNHRLHHRELAAALTATGPGAILCDGERTALLAAASELAGWRGAVVPIDAEGAPYERLVAGTPAGAPAEPPGTSCARARSAATAPPAPPLGGEEIACLLFTGGTTGVARAARISYRMIASNTLTTAIHELQASDVALTHLPLFHAGGLLVHTVPLLLLGGRVVLVERWDPGVILELVARERATVFLGVPSQYRELVSHPRFAAADLASLRFATSGGAPLPAEVVRAWRRHQRVPLKQGFGMTEFGPGAFSMTAAEAAQRIASIGRPNCGVEARALDDAGQPVAPGQIGELALRGPALFSGYLGHGARDSGIDPDGWFHTGDLVRIDEAGLFEVVGRRKHMYISGGENVFPEEIETLLAQHPLVRDCAVSARADARWGEVGRALVVPAAGASLSAEVLLDFLGAHLARYKLPREFVFVDALPRGENGKLRRAELAGWTHGDGGRP